MKILAHRRLKATLTPNKAVHDALDSFEKDYGIRFTPQDRKSLALHLGKKAYLRKHHSGAANTFDYFDKVAARQPIDLRQNIKNFDKVYDILTKPDYALVDSSDDSWRIRVSDKGKDFFYFLNKSMSRL